MASTSVVLPWSTWAMMAILRIVWLTGAGFPSLWFGVAGRAVGGLKVDQIAAQRGQLYFSSNAPRVSNGGLCA
jgi:hypothetical protein